MRWFLTQGQTRRAISVASKTKTTTTPRNGGRSYNSGLARSVAHVLAIEIGCVQKTRRTGYCASQRAKVLAAVSRRSHLRRSTLARDPGGGAMLETTTPEEAH